MVLARSTPPARSPADGPALSPVEGPALSLVEGPCLDGKFLRIDGGRFLVKGVSYGTFAPGPGRAQFPAPARVAGDFAAMAAAEFNTVRTYTVPPMAVLDAAAAHGLRVMVGLPWPQHVAFLDDPRLVRQIRRDAAAEVRRLAAHPAALLFAIGNEIPPGVVRWHGPRRVERFLRELCDEVKAAAPESLLTYVNFPPTDYLELECVDVCAFNVYLHREADLRAYLSRLQHIAGPRPLLLAEAGADSRREGLDGQARLDAMQVRAALAEGACGAVAFAWTDEWWRGGRAVDDWAFGLVDAERRPKPALAAAARAFADGPFAAEERVRWPKVSVIVCARDAEDTIDDCLTSLAALTYPNVELLVINDGSRDATSAIARRHPSVRVIDVPPGGLSAARNMGLAEASGEIVAYTDADVRVDPDWLTYLVPPLLDQDVVGVGGPNVVPADDPWLAQCVARAPGGPTHVLLDDRIAEHVPGCNMAFRRDALLAIGGFNPVYVRAGDDVDVCWRLQAAGHRIGFAGAALVWHHHRASVRAFWRQQVGYGEAESWLDAHHPEKSAGGAPLWRGRIYSPLPFVRALSSRTVNTGVWGTAAFPSVYATGIHLLQVLPHSPVWLALSSALMLIGALLPDASGAASPLLAVGLGGWLTTLVRCVQFAWRSDVARLSRIGRLSLAQSRLVYRAVIAWLHVIQPLARTGGRLRGMWSMPHLAPAEGVAERADLERADLKVGPDMGRGVFADLQGLAGLVRERSYWSEAWVAHTELLTRFATTLRASRAHPIVEVDDGWHAGRDVSVAVGRWGWLHVRMLIEEHDRGRCLVRTAAHLRVSAAGIVQVTALAVAVAAATAVSWLGPLAELAALGVLAGAIGQAARGTAMLERALRSVTVDAGMTPLPLAARSAAEETGTSQGAGPLGWFVPSSRPVLAATALVLLAALGVGGVSLGRGVTPDAASGGGVAVGIAGDVFVADARQGLIRRLRPRPPLGAAWTADDLGTDGHPLLGHEVPFDAAADIAVAPDGDLYVADARRHRISLVDRSTGRVVTVAGSGSAGFGGDGGPAAAAALRGPSAVAVGRDGNLYIADTLNHRVRAVSRATGVITTIAGDGQTASGAGVGDGGPAVQARLNRPSGLAVAPNGDVYVADTGHRRVRRIDAATGVITTVAGDGRAGSTGDGGPAVRASLAAPVGLALVSRGERLVVYVADVLDSRVRVFEPGGAIATLGRADRVLAPTRVAYHPAGWLYVKDASPDGVTAVAADSPAGLGRPAASAEASAPRAGPPLRTVLSPGSPGRSGRTVS